LGGRNWSCCGLPPGGPQQLHLKVDDAASLEAQVCALFSHCPRLCAGLLLLQPARTRAHGLSLPLPLPIPTPPTSNSSTHPPPLSRHLSDG
jgi:hypothetical protein